MLGAGEIKFFKSLEPKTNSVFLLYVAISSYIKVLLCVYI